MPETRKILIVVPYKARDLDGLALLGYYLTRRYGYEIVFSNGYRLETKILQHAPDMLVLDHLAWNFKVEQAKLAKSLGMKVVILPTEGLFQDEEGAVRRAGKLHNAAHLPDRYLTWGDFPRRALLNQELMTERQVKTVGCPRFDFYSDPFLDLMPEKKELLKRLGFTDFSAPIVLWATNTPYSSREASVIIERQTRRAKKPLEEVQAHIEDHKTQFREHSQIVLELARRRSEWNFIIKVHPAEWINPYLDLEKETANLKVAYNAPIGQFLRHADILLQRNCTTATEAWTLGKPVLNLEIGEYRRPVRDEFARGNHQVYSVDEAETAIAKYLDGANVSVSQQTAREEFIADFYYKIDGKSHERCAAVIHELLSAPEYTTEAQTLKNKLTEAAASEKKKRDDARLINKVKDLFGVERDKTLRFWKGYFRKEAVHNAGKFTAEPEITQEMAAELYRKFDALSFQENRFVKNLEKEVLLSST